MLSRVVYSTYSLYNLMYINLFFIIYSVLGYIAEVIFCTLYSRKFVWNRGFLIGPYLPIYGVGALIVTFLLQNFSTDFFSLFLFSAVFCTLLEYLSSLVLEEIFHLRWWDYSEKKYNLDGRVCLSNSILFGVGGIVIVKFLNPIINSFIIGLDSTTLRIITSVILFFFLTDLVLSIRIIFGFSTNLTKISRMDSTNQIKKEVNNYLKNYRVLTGRLLKSFPNLENLNKKNLKNLVKMHENIKQEIRKLKDKRQYK